MVRFIILFLTCAVDVQKKFTFQYGQIYYTKNKRKISTATRIYIPIWLDLLFVRGIAPTPSLFDLHSNMVRFIIKASSPLSSSMTRFTFQYGQIYYLLGTSIFFLFRAFTFQYGQIYYFYFINIFPNRQVIYIPIWLDLLLRRNAIAMRWQDKFTFQYGQIYYKEGKYGNSRISRIYIPIWLDLLFYFWQFFIP